MPFLELAIRGNMKIALKFHAEFGISGGQDGVS